MKHSRLKKAVYVMFYGNPSITPDGKLFDVQVFPSSSGQNANIGGGVYQKWLMQPNFEQPAGGNPVDIDSFNIPDNLIEVQNY